MDKVYQIIFADGQIYTGVTHNTVYEKIKNFEKKWVTNTMISYNLRQAYKKNNGKYRTHVIMKTEHSFRVRNSIIKSSQGKDLNTAYDPFISPFWL